MALRPTFLGSGFSYPFRLNATLTAPAFSRDEQLVKEDMTALVGTGVGERPFRVRNGVPYGTRVRALLFSNDEGLFDLVRHDVREALRVWEPRIIVLEVDVERFVDTITRLVGAAVLIQFRYRATNRSDNFVIPFRTEPVEETAA